MSVINKMLRDLDRPELSRSHLVAVAAPVSQGRVSDWMQGTLSVDIPVADRVPSRRRALWFVSALTALGLAAMPWLSEPFSLSQATAKPAPVAPVAVVASQVAAGVIAPLPITPALSEASIDAPTPDALALPMSLTMAVQIDRVPVPRPVAKPDVPRQTESATSPRPTPGEIRQDGISLAPTLSTPVSLPAVDSQMTPVRREATALEITGQAQRLWNSGSHDAAIELLKDALAVMERAAGFDMARAASGDLIPMVRELARMELAEGQIRQVLELLKRLEPALAGQADLWAVRANAAQRLGSHQEAIYAYQTALALRPGESRWMLGAAVSMAARGQTTSALELAEKARVTGTVSSDIVAYLRQLGVPLKD